MMIATSSTSASPFSASQDASDVVFEFLQALPARPLLALLEMVSEKIKASWLHRIYHSCFVWMQLQSCLRSPFFQQFQGLPGFSFALTHYHQVGRIACHLKSRLFHQMVQRIQIDIG